MKLTGNAILITGGGAGIGMALTERFLKEKNTPNDQQVNRLTINLWQLICQTLLIRAE